MDKRIISVLMIYVLREYTNGACTFSSDIQGTWLGGRDVDTNKDIVFQFYGEIMKNYPFNFNTFQLKKNFECYDKEINGDGTRYILKATEPMKIFNMKVDLYLCLDINGQKYAIETEINGFLGDRVFALAVGKSVTNEEICNKNDRKMKSMTKSADKLSRESVRDLERLLEQLEKRIHG